jgi:membrane-associated protein
MMTTSSSRCSSSGVFGALSSTSSSLSKKKIKENKTNVSVRRRQHQRPHHHHHSSETKRDGRRAGAALSVAAVMMPSLLPSSHHHQHQSSSSSSSSSVVSLDNNNNIKRGKVAAKAAAAARDYHQQQQQSEEDTTISSVNSTTTTTIQERVLNENNASQKRRNKLLGLFGKGSMMFVLVALMVTASALLFPETALAKSKAVIAEQSSGFSVKVILDWILHLDKHLVELFATSGKMAYGVLFGIIFAETGFVVTPFLPGDSLLFACGALGAIGVLNFPLVYGLLFLAAVLGDTVNYMCGSFFGEVAIRKNPRIFKPDYIAKTRTFYDKYGGRTVVLARFFVIVRTFAPFIAGVAKMNYSKFALYNVMGAGVWITSFMGLGYFFGNVPVVKENFATTIVVIILLSLLPIIVEIVNHKKDSSANSASA